MFHISSFMFCFLHLKLAFYILFLFVQSLRSVYVLFFSVFYVVVLFKMLCNGIKFLVLMSNLCSCILFLWFFLSASDHLWEHACVMSYSLVCHGLITLLSCLIGCCVADWYSGICHGLILMHMSLCTSVFSQATLFFISLLLLCIMWLVYCRISWRISWHVVLGICLLLWFMLIQFPRGG